MPLFPTVTAALAAACLFAFVQPRAIGATHDPAPIGEDVKKAERIIRKLHRLEEAASEDSRAYESAVEKLYPGLFAEVAGLREGDLKTDLVTAVFLHEAAARTHHTANAPGVACEDELRDVYFKLCRDNGGGGRARLLRAKARLHARWAEALVDHARGRRDARASESLAEMRAERRIDLALASRAVAALRSLGADVNPYRTLAEFEEGRAVAGVSFERFSQSASAVFAVVDRVLASLPRGPVRRHLHNARNSYRDGLFWWQKTHTSGAPTISADALAEGDMPTAIDAGAANYTVVINWRNAVTYTARAEQLIRASAVNDIASQPQP